MSIYFEEEKTKIIPCDTKNELHQVGTLDIRYGSILIKHNNTVTYLGCSLDKNVSKESMALKFINKINNRLRFLHRKNIFLSQPLCRIFCNTSIQAYFNYAF